MAFKVIQTIVIAAVIAGTLTEPPVRIDEQHLRVPASQVSGNGWQDSVPGLPGKDYPNLSSIPKTSFSCAGKTPGGYYADVETRCQVFHVCNTEGTKSSFLCPSGSIFNQRHFVCDWWYDFECERAPDLYSLNDALDDHESTSDQSESDRYSPNAPLPYNSIGASNNDLSLASSGYPNNIRDEANLIYEDYASGKIIEAEGNLIPEKPAAGASAGAVASPLSGSKNYSDAHSRESAGPEHLNVREQLQSNDYQRSSGDASDSRSPNWYEHQSNYRGRSRPLSDNVPRGFSTSHPEDLKRNDNGPGFFVNNGLFEERDKNQENTNARGSSNFIDNQHGNEFNKSEEKNSARNNNAGNVRYGIYYQNPEKYPLPQENNNYVNNDNKEIKENNYYNKNEINWNYQYSNNGTFENYKKSENVESRTLTSKKYHDFTEEPYSRILEYAATTARAISSDPTEDEVDREWQRVVDSTELKRNSAQRSNYDYESSASFLLREESGHPWREDLTTSSSGLSSPPYAPGAPNFPEGGRSDYDTSTLSRPDESTTPTAKERPKFLGRRPAGGLLSGTGNGLPGAKVLAGSLGITGKPGEDTASTVGPYGNEAWDTRDKHPPRNEGNKFNEFTGAGPYSNK